MKDQTVDSFQNEDKPGQDKSPGFIKAEELKGGKVKLIHKNEFELPTIKTRYFSMLIDVIVITLLALGVAEIFYLLDDNVPDYIRAAMFVIVVILYEPILVSTGCTFGQLILNIRVRQFKDPQKKIWFFAALLRLIAKAFLGWISFLTVTFNINRRAIHDYASGSIVIVPK